MTIEKHTNKNRKARVNCCSAPRRTIRPVDFRPRSCEKAEISSLLGQLDFLLQLAADRRRWTCVPVAHRTDEIGRCVSFLARDPITIMLAPEGIVEIDGAGDEIVFVGNLCNTALEQIDSQGALGTFLQFVEIEPIGIGALWCIQRNVGSILRLAKCKIEPGGILSWGDRGRRQIPGAELLPISGAFTLTMHTVEHAWGRLVGDVVQRKVDDARHLSETCRA
jgi:hypothetical protein